MFWNALKTIFQNFQFIEESLKKILRFTKGIKIYVYQFNWLPLVAEHIRYSRNYYYFLNINGWADEVKACIK